MGGMYFASDKMLEAWGADSKSVNPVFLKFMGVSIAAIGATFWLLTTGETAIKTLGMTPALYLASMIDSNFISKDAPGSKNAQYFWMVINAAVCYFTLSWRNGHGHGAGPIACMGRSMIAVHIGVRHVCPAGSTLRFFFL